MPSDAFHFRLEFPPELPISSRAADIVAAIQENQVVILAGETGSGKTTQIPKMCLAAGRGTRGRIACTQPRRVAALSISRRVAEELDVGWGREVGCKVRFSDQTTRATVIKFLTDGMLLAEAQGDPMLREYDTIIVDEAHERSLNIDFIIGHLRQLRFRRPELRIIITSATIDTKAFSEAFDGAPVIEVSGRTFPVETVYLPLDGRDSDFVEEEEGAMPEDADPASARAEALHYVDGAVEAALRVLESGRGGDLLVFMPSERDIRECCDQLEERLGKERRSVELVPLFGRLSNSEQQRVFAPTQRRKIVVATNIAETSLTIPGIGTVIDTGLARVSRYAPQARTRRLPIEPVSQSSADQRKGRAGRVSEGLCLRLYSEEDYLARPRFTQPEIQRANLADVILRLKASRLGEVERFPFINPPATKAVRAGYALLEELGALETLESEAPERRETGKTEEAQVAGLSGIGRELARLPVDPTVGRMILQARVEKCLGELLVIASGLSIQDPRERPLDKQAAADAAHRRFAHPDSDFLTLLKLWDAYHGEFESLSQARLRRFCREHFLSYVRMREWRDIYTQLAEVVEGLEGVGNRKIGKSGNRETGAGGNREDRKSGNREIGKSGNSEDSEYEREMRYGSQAYRAIHRSVLAGLLGNIALLDEETRLYKATQDRKVALFPGSVLHVKGNRRAEKSGNRESGKAENTGGGKGARWIMASEIVETTRVYARTCAKLDPRWVLDLGRHLLKLSHSEPFYDEEGGRVLVKQRTRLYGLELDLRSVGYAKINPEHATEIFIREGLVNDTIRFPLDFIAHNRSVRERIEFSLTRTRDSGYLNLDEALYRYYAARLMPAEGEPGVGSVAELVDLVRHRRGAEPGFLMVNPEELRDPETLKHDAADFPEALPVENRVIPLSYAYKPGQTEDGVTLEVKARDAAALTPAALDWAVPGHTQEKVEHYLRSLPKELRREFVPLSETLPAVTAAVESLARLRGGSMTLVALLTEHLKDRFGFRFDASVWEDKPLPEHLVVRVKVLDDAGRELCASRDLSQVKVALETRQRELSVATVKEEPELWRRARARWEKPESETWIFGNLADTVEIGQQAGVGVLAYPALVAGKGGVALRLMRDLAEARAATAAGLERLIELQLSRDLGWLERDLKALRQAGPVAMLIAPLEQLQADAFVMLRGWLCDPGRVVSATEAGKRLLKAASFAAAVERARRDLAGLVPRMTERLRELADLRQELVTGAQAYPGLAAEVAALMPADFFRTTPYPQLQHLPRYLKAKQQRAEKLRQNPAKDAERAKLVEPYARRAAALGRGHRLYWLVEEFRVSLFAQELGTSESVSAVRLEREFEQAGRETPVPPPSPRPATPAPEAGKPKKTTFKSFDSLGRLGL